MSGKQALHPARDTLAAYGLGKLQPTEAVAVETHIAECEECCETLLDLGNDTFVDLVRRSDAAQLGSIGEGTIGHDANRTTVGGLPDELKQHPRYRVLELLGKGGMGNVYKAEHTLMNRSVALKLINRELVQNSQAVERFRREVQSAAQLAHPNIVTAYDAEQAGDVHFLVMEYVPGDNLSEVVKRNGPLNVAQACDYIRQAANGLQHAHVKGMVHRDIKPHNLMVTTDGQVKILDFGLATLTAETISAQASDQGGEGDTDRHTSPNLTSAGSMMGTPDFISPEQASDARAADIRSDIYSLGCTFYYLLTGRPPFTEGSPMERIKAHGEMEPEPIETVRGDIPSELADALRRMMAKDPAERFQTPAEIADALAPFVDTYRTTAEPKTNADYDKGAYRSSRSRWVPTKVQALMLGACVLILGAIVYVTTDGGTLVVESEDDSVQITVRPVTEGSRGGHVNGDEWEYRIDDTVTGSTVKWLRSGDYVVRLQGSENDFQLSHDQFILRRGTTVVVRVTRRKNIDTSERLGPIGDVSGSPAPNGQFLPLVDWSTGDLAVRETASGKIRRLTNKGTWMESSSNASGPVVSPDSQKVAYCWFTDKGYYNQLRIVGLDAGQPQTLIDDPRVTMMQLYQWSKDDQILALIQFKPDHKNQIALVSSKNGKVRTVRDLGKRYPVHMSISADGRYIAYDLRVEEGSTNRDVYLLDISRTDRVEQTTLVNHPGTDYGPIWTPDGRVVFFSDRSGNVSLSIIQVADGRPETEPQLIKQDVNRMLPMGFTDDGSLYCKVTSGQSDVYVTTVASEPGKVNEPPEKVTRVFEGYNSSPSWSPDGKRLAYISFRGPLPAPSGQPAPGGLRGPLPDSGFLVVRTLETGEERKLAGQLSAMSFEGSYPIRWSPNSQFILLNAVDLNGERGLYKVDAESGAVAPVVTQSEVGGQIGCADWSDDGNAVFYHSLRSVTREGQAVVRRELGTGQEKEIWRPSGGNLYLSFDVSPNGRTLACARQLPPTIHFVPTEGGKPIRSVQLKGRIGSRGFHGRALGGLGAVAWGPDNKTLFFARRAKDESRQSVGIWHVSVGGGEPKPLGVIMHGLGHLSVHPDGRKIAYSAGGQKDEVVVLKHFLPPFTNATGAE